jgi:hypothetical protein
VVITDDLRAAPRSMAKCGVGESVPDDVEGSGLSLLSVPGADRHTIYEVNTAVSTHASTDDSPHSPDLGRPVGGIWAESGRVS